MRLVVVLTEVDGVMEKPQLSSDEKSNYVPDVSCMSKIPFYTSVMCSLVKFTETRPLAETNSR